MSSTIETASTSSRKLAANAPSVSAAENCLIQVFGLSPKLACELSQRRSSAKVAANPSAERWWSSR